MENQLTERERSRKILDKIKREKEGKIKELLERPVLLSLRRNSEGVLTELKGLEYRSVGRLIDENGVFISKDVIEGDSRHDNLRALVLGDNVKEIGKEAFARCEDLEYFKANNNLKKIGKKAFSCCTNLTYIDLNNGLEEIESKAFYQCYSIYEGVLTVPGTVKRFGVDPFIDCSIEKIVTTKEVAENYIKNCAESRDLKIIATEGDRLYLYTIDTNRWKLPRIKRNTYKWEHGFDEAINVYRMSATQLYYSGKKVDLLEEHKLLPNGEWERIVTGGNKEQRVKEIVEKEKSVSTMQREK